VAASFEDDLDFGKIWASPISHREESDFGVNGQGITVFSSRKDRPAMTGERSAREIGVESRDFFYEGRKKQAKAHLRGPVKKVELFSEPAGWAGRDVCAGVNDKDYDRQSTTWFRSCVGWHDEFVLLRWRRLVA